MEFLTGTGLAVAAGLNAYIPLLILGLGGRFLDFVVLPTNWAWLENPWVLAILAVLLVIEIVADKIPVVDSINDWVQTIVRPVAGGIAFGTGSASGTAVVTDPRRFSPPDRGFRLRSVSCSHSAPTRPRWLRGPCSTLRQSEPRLPWSARPKTSEA